MSKRDDETIERLIAAGVIIVAGVGLFRIAKSMGSHAIGRLVSRAEASRLLAAATAPAPASNARADQTCQDCGRIDPDRCRAYMCGRCLACTEAYDNTICQGCYGSIYD